MTQFNFSSTGDEVVAAFIEHVKDRISERFPPSLSSSISQPLSSVVITGASDGGIGGEAAISLAAGAPNRLVLVGRNISNAQPVVDKIKAKHPSTQVSFVQCNLSSQTSVRTAAAEIIDSVPCIDILVNNAALPPCPYSKTEDGIESQFGTNHIGHFLLTNLLIPKILAAKPGARIVNVSSSAYRHAARPAGDDYNFSNGATYSEREGYFQSKAANVLFAKCLAQKLAPHGIQAFSLHPGSIPSGLQKHVSKAVMAEALKKTEEAAAREGRVFTREVRKTAQQGCSTTLVAALDPGIARQSGAYLVDGGIAEVQPSGPSMDMETAEKLWRLSEELVGHKFDWV